MLPSVSILFNSYNLISPFYILSWFDILPYYIYNIPMVSISLHLIYLICSLTFFIPSSQCLTCSRRCSQALPLALSWPGPYTSGNLQTVKYNVRQLPLYIYWSYDGILCEALKVIFPVVNIGKAVLIEPFVILRTVMNAVRTLQNELSVWTHRSLYTEP